MTTRAIVGRTAGVFAALAIAFTTSSEAQIINDIEAQVRLQWMEMKRHSPRHPSERVQRFAQCIAYSIIDVIPEEFQDLDWEIIVFDEPAKNAMVTPDGKIAIFSGIFEVADTAEKLAAVLGHETAHLTQNHVKERVRRATMTGLVGVFGGAATGLGGESQTGAMVVMQLPFQREQEREADLVGMQFMAQAGYNPAMAMEVWRAMGAESEPGSRPPEFLSTHPEPRDRMTDMARNLAPALVAYNAALDAGVRPRCQL